MVCVGASEILEYDFAPGTKTLSATENASLPERRMTARAPSPTGVAIAAIVSSSISVREGPCLHPERCRFQRSTDAHVHPHAHDNCRAHFPLRVPAGTVAPSGNFFCAGNAARSDRW